MRSPGEVCDEAGNCTTCETVRVRIDKTTPTITYDPSSRTNWGNELDVDVEITVGSSGINTIRRRLSSNNGATYGSWETRSGDFTESLTTSGEHRIRTEVTSNSNCSNTVTSGLYRVDDADLTAPIISGGSTAWTNGNRTITIEHGSAGVSGVNRTEYRTRDVGGSLVHGKLIVVL